MTNPEKITVYIDPWNPELYDDGLFDMSERPINRDEVLACWGYLHDVCEASGIHLKTADRIPPEGEDEGPFLYYNIGSLVGYKKHRLRSDIILGSIYLFEPPIGLVPAGDAYLHLPELSREFRRVYTTCPLDEINKCYGRVLAKSPIMEFSYPQTHDEIIRPLWNNVDRKPLVMINSYSYSPMRKYEFYSERIRAVGYFKKHGSIDLYGHRWNKITGNILSYIGRIGYDAYRRHNFARMRELPVVLGCRGKVREAWVGPCNNELYRTLSKYEYSICYESMGIKGFITEKLFNCFMVGTIPIYLGAPDVQERIPKECFIDKREFNSYSELNRYIMSMPIKEKLKRKNAGREFFYTEAFRPFSKNAFARRFLLDLTADVESCL